MFGFKSMSNSVFETQFKEVVGNERRVSVEVLHHFREAERRMLYAERGRKSLREYAIKDLKYSEPAADRRIAAMRTMREMPEVEERIKTGELSLSTINETRRTIRMNDQATGTRATAAEKKELLESVEGLSFNEAKRVLADACPAAHHEVREKINPTANGTYKLETTLTDELHAILEEIQDLMGKRVEIRELVLDMAKERLERLRKKRGVSATHDSSARGGCVQSKPERTKRNARRNNDSDPKTADRPQVNMPRNENEDRNAEVEKATRFDHRHPDQQSRSQSVTICETDIEGKSSPNGERNGSLKSKKTNERDCADQSKQSTKRRNYIAVKIDRALRARAGHQCEYIDPETNTRCSERRHLERDHVIEIALGGDDSLENLQLFCSNHNKLKATHQFGFDLMADFMPSLH